jgi:hypothetical protein
MFVQGQTNASRKWGDLVEAFIFKELGLLASRQPMHLLWNLSTTAGHPLLCHQRFSTYLPK